MAHSVWNTSELEKMTHHEKVNFFIISSYADYFIPPSLDEKLQLPHRLTFYFFVYRIKGAARHVVDFADIPIKPGQLLFLYRIKSTFFHQRMYPGSGIRWRYPTQRWRNCRQATPSCRTRWVTS
jgi:hypothetical protein